MFAERFVLGTHNPDKARELVDLFTELFEDPLVVLPIEIDRIVHAFVVQNAADNTPVPHLDIVPNVEENGATLEENARIKARAWCKAVQLPALSEDTGLFVDALDGQPGIHAARYAGEHVTYEDNWRKLLQELQYESAEKRSAHFATVALISWPDGREVSALGVVHGMIATESRGSGGMGYDPVFIPEGSTLTFAEMPDDTKNEISHRARAVRALTEKLQAG